MTWMVETENLTKRFDATVAVEGLSFHVAEGDVMGFIGPNGAGKSTTLKMLATLLRPTNGVARVNGLVVTAAPQAVRRIIGYMPDVCGLYEDMLVHEYLRFFASIYGITGERVAKTVDDVLGLTGLESKASSTCKALSRGMSQRLHLARVLLHDPRLLLLDEPASGLDPRARIEFRELVLTLKKMGKTLIISSHILTELGEMCDQLVIIEHSKLVFSGPVSEVSGRAREEGAVYRVGACDEPEQGRSHGDLAEIVRSRPYVDAVREAEQAGRLLVRFVKEWADVWELNRELVSRGFKVTEFHEEPVRLEEAFLRLTRGLVQ